MVKDPTFDRVAEEQRNVTVDAWVLASSKESDNDFHMIIAVAASDGDGQPDRWHLMNAEVSGLPPMGTPGRDALERARKQFRDYFVPTVSDASGSGYTILDPVHVRLTGSLFFDVDHPAGAVGPGALKPATAWEIHPVTNLEILN